MYIYMHVDIKSEASSSKATERRVSFILGFSYFRVGCNVRYLWLFLV